jgi:nucleoid-associated protein YgaU
LGSLDWLRVDFADLSGWTRRTRVEDALAAVLRYVALAGGYWLLGSTMLYLIARISGKARLIDATALLTLPAVRRVTDRLVIGTIAVSALAGPAIAVTNPWGDRQPAIEVTDPIETRLGPRSPSSDAIVDLRSLESPADEPTTPGATVPVDRLIERATTPEPAITISDGAHLEVVVTEGDHLWALAERRVSSTLGRPAADHEVAPYWRQVVSSNPEIRSGDPDLIYPGEVIVLPPFPDDQ